MNSIILGKDVPSCSLMCKEISYGGLSICYETQDSKIFKKFNEFNYSLERMIAVIDTYSSDSFIFPETFVYVDSIRDENLVGYIMRKINGPTFDDFDGNMPYIEFLKSVRDFEKELIRLSSLGLRMVDMNTGNVYNEFGNIVCADIDAYSSTTTDQTKHNFAEFSTTIYSLLRLINVEKEYAEKYSKMVPKNDYLLDLIDRQLKSGEKLPSEFLEDLYNCCDNDIYTCGDISECIHTLKI